MTTNASGEDAALTQWLRQRLSFERELLEMRHSALLQDFQAHQIQRAAPCHPQVPPSDAKTCMTLDVEHVPLERAYIDAKICARAVELEDVKPQGIAVQNTKLVLLPEDVEPTGMEDTNIQDIHDPPKVEDCFPEENFGRNSTPSKAPRRKTVRGKGSFIATQGAGRTQAKTRMEALVRSRRFELFFAFVIFMNMIEMALYMQYHGFQNGHTLGYPGYSKPKEEVWPNMEGVFAVMSWLFGITYTVELVFKMIGLRREFLESWNIFDFCIVLVFYIESFAVQVRFPIDTMLLRLFRLFKVLRLLRLVHEIAGLAELLLMVTALKGSLHMLVWATMLLFGLLTSFAFILNQLLSPTVIENDDFAMETREKCFKYFGTFSRAIFSMFELTLANWVPISRFLAEDISGFFVLFAIGYKLTLGFAVVGVVNACFIKETFKIVATDRTMMVIERQKEKAAFAGEMTQFMAHADTDGDNLELTFPEFADVCNEEQVKHWLGAQGLDVSDAKLLFDLMDDGSGVLELQELVKGVAKLKGPAKSLDLAVLRKEGQDHARRMAQFERKLQHLEEECHIQMKDTGKLQQIEEKWQTKTRDAVKPKDVECFLLKQSL